MDAMPNRPKKKRDENSERVSTEWKITEKSL